MSAAVATRRASESQHQHDGARKEPPTETKKKNESKNNNSRRGSQAIKSEVDQDNNNSNSNSNTNSNSNSSSSNNRRRSSNSRTTQESSNQSQNQNQSHKEHGGGSSPPSSYNTDGPAQTPSTFLAQCSKLDLEPNPFEQSFGVPAESSEGSSKSTLLPPVAHLTSPSPLMPQQWQFNSLRSGPLSPAMLSGPSQSSFDASHIRTGLTPNESGIRTGLTPGGSGSMFPAPSPTTAALFGFIPGNTPASTPGAQQMNVQLSNGYSANLQQQGSGAQRQANGQPRNKGQNPDPDSAAANGLYLLSQAQDEDQDMMSDQSTPSGDEKTDFAKHDGKRESSTPSASNGKRVKTKKEGVGEYRKVTDEAKRKNFLERNRQAALKCRQRKKQWLANLQNKVEFYGQENEALNAQVAALREEIVNLKTLLLAHKDCPVAHANGAIGGIDAINQAISAPEFPGGPNMGMMRRY